jgi:NAD(P)-dependent dehydrogenase (short-subunit alcohol dehydrogenase family)
VKRLEGKVAIIIGGNSGIGFATAQRFVEEGAYVFITGRRQGELDAAVNQIGKNIVTGVQGDVSSLGDLDSLYARVKEEQKGRIDALFANAGIGNWHHWGKSPKPTLTKYSASTPRGFCSVSKKRFRCFRMEGQSF